MSGLKATSLRLTAAVASLALLVQGLTGCAGEATYVWAEELKEPEAPVSYVIAPGDVLSVRVFNQDNMSTRARVRSDGKIAVPFVGDVDVLGKTPAAVAKELSVLLKEYVVSPTVTITIEETLAATVSVLGEVARPGIYPIDASTGVLQALAAAGGFTDYASRGSIYLVRRSPAGRIRLSYSALTQGTGKASQFRLHAGDVLLVE
ncbi:MAG: polysaccharide biosynthesis/export family protein [Minicystis sp.]